MGVLGWLVTRYSRHLGGKVRSRIFEATELAIFRDITYRVRTKHEEIFVRARKSKRDHGSHKAKALHAANGLDFATRIRSEQLDNFPMRYNNLQVRK